MTGPAIVGCVGWLAGICVGAVLGRTFHESHGGLIVACAAATAIEWLTTIGAVGLLGGQG